LCHWGASETRSGREEDFVATAWLYVINDGSGSPNVVRSSHSATTVTQVQPGEYVVTLPFTVSGLAPVATLNNSVGTITAVPGDKSGLSPNQVRVLTLSLQNQLVGSFDFSLAVFYSVRWPWWPWLVAILGAGALFLLLRQ
jgi:hypothetical protein